MSASQFESSSLDILFSFTRSLVRSCNPSHRQKFNIDSHREVYRRYLHIQCSPCINTTSALLQFCPFCIHSKLQNHYSNQQLSHIITSPRTRLYFFATFPVLSPLFQFFVAVLIGKLNILERRFLFNKDFQPWHEPTIYKHRLHKLHPCLIVNGLFGSFLFFLLMSLREIKLLPFCLSETLQFSHFELLVTFQENSFLLDIFRVP